jgi:hypothetical protein
MSPVTKTRRPDELREIKVTIPAELHLHLVRAKFLKGRPMGESVRAALHRYFEERPCAACLPEHAAEQDPEGTR